VVVVSDFSDDGVPIGIGAAGQPVSRSAGQPVRHMDAIDLQSLSSLATR